MTLYLKYRPNDFESLVGQDFIKNTLRQAIAQEKLVGAYLFCGPRGTGKTSTARIFAKAMNCLSPQNGNPCNVCEICQSFNDESLVDIIEIDAASYTGVDNIRDIIERAQFSPTKSKYKVYIIDEVHMLSKGAFNALLKILEEPPAHLKFILATTEVHKVPETILSRCQRYDFKSISENDLKNRLKEIASKEGITIDIQSLDFINKEARGGLRNAISLFEQLIVGNEIVFENIISNYGVPKNEIISSIYERIFSSDETLVAHFDELVANYNINLFFKELLFFIKDKMIESIHDESTLKRNVFLLETLEEVYTKSKYAFDTKTMYLVGIVKCIKNIQVNTQSSQQGVKKISLESTPVHKIPKKIEEDIPSPMEVPDEITGDDLFDIFGNDEGNEITAGVVEIPQETPFPSVPSSTDNVNFDVEKFITTLKSIGAKGALTMSLRGSTLQFDGKKLIVYTKTKIALKQIASSDNLALMSQAGAQLGLDLQIEIK